MGESRREERDVESRKGLVAEEVGKDEKKQDHIMLLHDHDPGLRLAASRAPGTMRTARLEEDRRINQIIFRVVTWRSSMP